MKNARRKDFIREIKGNKGRFLSIFFIVLLGAAFFSGIRSSGTDMKYTADHYFDEYELMDIKIQSTMGLTEDDLDDIKAVDGVEAAYGGYTQEVLNSNGTDEYAIKLIGLSDDINKFTLEDGRMPEKADECVVDKAYMSMMDYEIGDTISFRSGTDDDLSESMKITEFTIVGTGSLPYYIDLTRGVGTIGDGQLKGYVCIEPEAFDLDIYTEIYVKIAGAQELNSYSDEYQDLVDEVSDRIEDISDNAIDRRYNEVVDEANEKIDDGKQQIEDAETELADAKKELDDGKTELDDSEEELADGKEKLDDAAKELADAKKELDDGKATLDETKAELDAAKEEIDSGEAELAASKKQLDEGEAQLISSKAELDEGEQQLSEAKETLDSTEKQLADAKSALDENKQKLDDAKSQIDSGKAEIETNEATLNEKAAEVEAGWTQYNAGVAELNEKKAQLEAVKTQKTQLEQQLAQVEAALVADPENAELLASKEQLTAAIGTIDQTIAEAQPQITQAEAALAQTKAQLDAADQQISGGRAAIETAKATLAASETQYNEGLAAYNSGLAQYQSGLSQYNEGKAQYETSLAQWESGKAQYEEGLAQWESGKAQYEEGLAQWESGKAQYEEGLAQWESGYAEYEEGLQEYEDGKKEYEDALAEYNDGLQQYEDGLKEWEDGNAEYQDKSADAEDEIAEGKADIADAESEIAKLEKPKWYILDRDMIQSVASYGSDADRIDSLGNVFPVIFFLVAALVSLTCMTRMVEEQRQQIGTFKALGYNSGQIAAKYIGYAMLATLTGAFAGVLIGEKLLPGVILSSYGMLYTGLPYYFIPYNWVQGILAIVLSAACTGGATLAACIRQLTEKPAELMRPEAPKSGKRILLERISFLWKKLNFTQKSTLRNLFRYKKRFIMTIIGIGGCMGLMLVGFGLRDSITVVAQNQFIEIFKQNATVSVDTNADEEDIEALEERIAGYSQVEDSMDVCLVSVTLNANGVDRTANIYVPKETDKVEDFVRFRDRVTKEEYEFPTNGVTLSEKTADMMHVSVGDTITIKKGENSTPVEVQVEGIIENYVQHYAFFTTETYEKLFGEEPEYNYIYVKYGDATSEYESRFAKDLLENDACTGVNFTNDLEGQIEDMLNTLDLVIWVLIIAAALLAFVVLYNLNSINITERRRELATLKVLGFNNMEVAMYIYRENIILTIIGIVAGAVIGAGLHLFTITTVEVDLMMFGRNIGLTSYLICAALTGVFSVLVNIVMFYHFRRIDMVESLKSVE